MVPLSIPNLVGNEKRYLMECIDTGFVSSVGPFVTRFEQKICEITGATSCVSVASGTCGLQLALLALGVRLGDLVILPSYTFIATPNAVHACGASPWLMDVDTKTLTMDPEAVVKAIHEKCERRRDGIFHKSSGRRVAALLPVFTHGHPADMIVFRRIADEYQIALIADAAPAIGAKIKNQEAALISDLGVYSFNGNKTFTSGGGGAVIGLNHDILEKVRHLSSTGRVGKGYDHDCSAFNFRMTNVEAAIGLAQLERFHEFIERKKEIFRWYREGLSKIDSITFFPEAPEVISANWLAGFIWKNAEASEMERIRDYFAEKGIEGRSFWKPTHLQTPYLQAFQEEMTVTDEIWSRSVVLPSSTGITTKEIDFVIESIKLFFKSI